MKEREARQHLANMIIDGRTDIAIPAWMIQLVYDIGNTIQAHTPDRTLIQKTLDGLCEEMCSAYVIEQVRIWANEEEKGK